MRKKASFLEFPILFRLFAHIIKHFVQYTDDAVSGSIYFVYNTFLFECFGEYTGCTRVDHGGRSTD